MPLPVQGSEYHETKEVKDIYPDFVMMAKSFGLPGKRVFTPEELRPAIRSAAGLQRWALEAPCAGLIDILKTTVVAF